MRKKRRLDYGYHCKYCHEFYQTIYELSLHCRTKHKPPTKQIPQLSSMSRDEINALKKCGIPRLLDKQARLSLRKFLPANYEWIRVWKVKEDDMGVHLLIEPLLFKKGKAILPSELHYTTIKL